MCYQDHFDYCLKTGNELGGYFKTGVKAGFFFVFLVLLFFVFVVQGWAGVVVVKNSSLPLCSM